MSSQRSTGRAPISYRGKVYVLPGISNLAAEFRPLTVAMRERHPRVEVDVRIWGEPLNFLENLTDLPGNREAAQEIADDITAYRRANPNRMIAVVGLSGGGGMSVLTVESLPDGVAVDRLILAAAAVSPDYPLEDKVLPHVSEAMVNFYSPLDQIVNLGTRVFGTIDGVRTVAAGHVGFSTTHPKLVQVKWDLDMLATGHIGTHASYLSGAWQRKYLLPWLNPEARAEDLIE